MVVWVLLGFEVAVEFEELGEEGEDECEGDLRDRCVSLCVYAVEQRG